MKFHAAKRSFVVILQLDKTKLGTHLVVPRCARNAENLCSCMCHTRARSDFQLGSDRDGKVEGLLMHGPLWVHHTLETRACVQPMWLLSYRFLEAESYPDHLQLQNSSQLHIYSISTACQLLGSPRRSVRSPKFPRYLRSHLLQAELASPETQLATSVCFSGMAMIRGC